MKTSECYRVPSEVADYRPSAFNDDADSSADETPPAQPVSPPPPVIPSAISSPASKEVPVLDDLTISRNEPQDHSDSGGDPRHSSDSDSDVLPPSRRSTRERHRPARYNDFVTDFI